MISRLPVIALAIALLSSACGGKKADCDATAKNVVALIRAELDVESKDQDRQRKESMLPALKEELVKQCKAEKWQLAVRTCVVEARSTAELDKCDPDGKAVPPSDELGGQPDEKPAN